ncbi:Tautomerase/MIF superfamily [Emericellopsis atlantica]|uniref:L-dopachrome isomerase n=1 Tax=Emericellopsis atlantica TaxID=2614577 RepID=A0A9P8CP93_9HYPO|nr:Tautomerase/MIF superfamily [Emericellopsis atlantica]KAG9253947.1 Tautomerase/MIF superfamily [Emericellopsis atlantica]
MASTPRSTRHLPSSPRVIPRNLPDPPHPPSGPRPEAPSTPSSSGVSTKDFAQQPLPPPPPPPPPIAPLRTPSSRPKQPRLPPVVEGDAHLLRDVRDSPPGESSLRRRDSGPGLSKQRSKYFNRVFGANGDTRQTRAVVVAEVKTNVFVQDEMAFLTALSDHLSTRYATPLDSIAVHLVHGTCLLLGGTFDPAYIISIGTLPRLLQTATNKRNAALLQKMMKDMLEVSMERGVVRYIPVAEDCLARGGKTLDSAATEDNEEGDGEGRPVRRRTTGGRFGRFKAKSPPPMPPLPAGVYGQEAGGATLIKREEKGLRHKKSFNFVQSIFRMPSRKGAADKDEGTKAQSRATEQ